MSADAAPAAPAPAPRPAVYGRNYSYFSHRIFVVFMPEEMHRYLHDRLELVPAAGGEAATDSDRLEMQLVRWVLLHRSQLNALAMNRLLESWRGDDDLLNIPAGLRSDPQYLMDITLQFALELELAAAQQSPMLSNRPRLLMALIDAAYFLSRQRLEADRQPDASGESLIDLSDTGLADFRRYLVQRMNLDEDRPDGLAIEDAASLHAEALSTEEVQWLQSVAVGVARTLTSASSRADLLQRWWRDVAPLWLRQGLGEPDQVLFDALLVGDNAPLEELPVAAGVEQPSGATPARRVGSLRFRWRKSSFPRAAWTRSLDEIVAGSRSAVRCIRAIERSVRRAMVPASAATAAGDASWRPLRDLADRYRLLPTTPSWASVEKAIEDHQRAARGLGTIRNVYRDSQLLQEYAAMLCRRETAEAVRESLLTAAALATFRAEGRQRPQDARFAGADADADVAALPDWEAALTALSDGLRCNEVDLPDVVQRVRDCRAQMQQEFPGVLHDWPGAEPVPRPDEGDGRRPLSLRFWRGVPPLGEAVRQACRGAMLQGPMLHSAVLPARAWQETALRAGGQTGPTRALPPAHATEIVCHLIGRGPGPMLPLRLEQATLRQWTQVAMRALRDVVPNLGVQGDPVPVHLAAHAFERLGMRALHAGLQEHLLLSLGPGTAALRPYIDGLRLWAGPQASGRVAVVVGARHGSFSNAWPLPPRDGLVLAVADHEFDELVAAVAPAWWTQTSEPVRIAIEPLPPASAKRIGQSIQARFGTHSRLVWLVRETPLVDPGPYLVDPKTADELWDVAERPPTPPA